MQTNIILCNKIQSSAMYLSFNKQISSRLMWLNLVIFCNICSACSSLKANKWQAKQPHNIQGHAFNFTKWNQSSAGFQCPYTQKYVILCKNRWKRFNEELETCRRSGVQCANGTAVTSISIMVIEAIVIFALLFYALKMRKKVIRNDLNGSESRLEIPKI